MSREDELTREIEILRHRLSQLTEASLRINESLDFDDVLQEVVDSARTLTGSRYGAITVFGEEGEMPDFIVSGLTREQHRGLWSMPEGQRFFQYLAGLKKPLRVSDIDSHLKLLNMPRFLPSVPVNALLVAPIRHQGVGVGTVYLSHGVDDREFTPEDEETLVMFASQAAMVIANVRRYRVERQARTDLETLVDTSPVGVVVFDAVMGAMKSLNREAQRIVDSLRNPDQTTEDLLDVVTFKRDDGREVSLQELPLNQLLNDGETVRAEEIVIRVPDGRRVSTLVNATPIRSEEGKVTSVVVTLQDMAPLEDLERMRAEFLATVSHELRTPLTSIKGSVTTLLDTAAVLNPAEILQFHRIIDSQTDRIRELISDLLDVVRIDTGTLSISPEPTDIGVLIIEARNAFISGSPNTRLHIDLEQGLPWVMADRLRVLQVLNNLLSNAARHSHESPFIRLTVVREGQHVAVTLADDGKGVSSERLPHLFAKFTRIEGDDQRNDLDGMGLGLSICKGIIEAHGGRIWAESDGPGLGARFTFTIPVAEDQATAVSVSPASVPSHSRLEPLEERMRILAVEDDPQALRYVRDILSKGGFVPVVTAGPEKALELVEGEKPHLVLLDLLLPGTDGIDLMKKILAIADVPVIFLSAYGRDEVVSKALDMGAVDYIVKPFSPTELLARIRVALRNRAESAPLEPFFLGDLVIDYSKHSVTLAGRPVHLTDIEYRMLVELSVNAGGLSTYRRLLQRVWGVEEAKDLRPMRTVVSSIRRKLKDNIKNSKYIFTQPRVGYRMPRGENSM